MRPLLPCALAALLLTAAASAEIAPGATAYVKVDNAKLREGDGLGGPTVAELSAGAPVAVLEVDRLRARVRAQSGATGWISLRQLQEKPPSGGGGLGGFVREDRSAQELGTAASGRGLSEAAAQMARAQNIDARVVEDVRRIEDFSASITDAEVDSFMREGGLNP